MQVNMLGPLHVNQRAGQQADVGQHDRPIYLTLSQKLQAIKPVIHQWFINNISRKQLLSINPVFFIFPANHYMKTRIKRDKSLTITNYYKTLERVQGLGPSTSSGFYRFNFLKVYYLQMIKICFPSLKSARGRVINMISNCTDCPLPTLSVYTSSKAGLKYLTHGMRPELAKYGIKVSVVYNSRGLFTVQLKDILLHWIVIYKLYINFYLIKCNLRFTMIS